MENRNTISSFNSKAWYRLLKVLFCLSLIAVLGYYNLIVFTGDIKKVDREETIITCKLTEDSRQISAAEAGIYFSSDELENFDYRNYFENNSFGVSQIIDACRKDTFLTFPDGRKIKASGGVGEDTIYRWQATADEKIATGKNLLDEFPNGVTTWISFTKSDWSSYITYKAHLFEIAPVFTYSEFIKFFLIGNVVILFIIEVIRRAFYYVVLGSLRPKK